MEQPRLRNADRGQLIERHVTAIGFDLDMFKQRRRGAPGAQTAKLLLERGDRPLHAVLEVIHVECCCCHGALRDPSGRFRRLSKPSADRREVTLPA